MLWNVITDFGDSAAMLPLATVLLAWLLINGLSRAAALWAALFAADALLVAATKIAFLGWGIGIPSLDFTGISGHSTLASSILPIGAFLATQSAGRTTRRLVTFGGFAGGLLIGVSRIALAQHSWSEVVAGCALGGGVALLFVRLYARTSRPARLPAPVIAGVLVCLALAIHGSRAPSQRLITQIALHLSGHSVPYMRDPYARMRLHWTWQDALDDLQATSPEAVSNAKTAMLAFHQVRG